MSQVCTARPAERAAAYGDVVHETAVDAAAPTSAPVASATATGGMPAVAPLVSRADSAA